MKRVPREWKTYEYYDPKVILPRLQNIRLQVSASEIPDKIRNLRTNRLKPEREAWDAAVFCYLISRATGIEMFFSKVESSDYDSVFAWNDGTNQCFAPVQMKELVPEYNNSKSTFESIIYDLKKYTDSDDLIVGIKLNRNTRIDFSSIKIPPLPVAEVYCFGATQPDEGSWILIGDILGKCGRWEYELPTAVRRINCSK